MRPDILFWFYKEFATCRNRIEVLRHLNPGVRIYGLYGGPLQLVEEAQRSIGPLLDDLYIYAEPRTSWWKWINGNRLIESWFRDRGQRLQWDTVFLHQWDMLALAPLEQLFTTLNPGELLLSGYRPLREVEAWWPWTCDPKMRSVTRMEEFREWLVTRFNYVGELFVGVLIVACLPRVFLEHNEMAGPPECGFMEYTYPTLAKVFGVPMCTQHPFNMWWGDAPGAELVPVRDRVLNAIKQEISPSLIQEELARPDGHRIFHPVFGDIPAAQLIAGAHRARGAITPS